MPHRRSCAAAVAAALLLVPATASAQDGAAGTTPTAGFGLSRSDGRLKLDIGRQAGPVYRRIAGRRGVLTCQEEPPTTGPVLVGNAAEPDVAVFTITFPKQRRGVTFKRRAPASLDSCELVVVGRASGNRTPRVIADLLLPLTDRGVVALRERTLVAQLAVVSTLIGALAAENPESSYPTADAVVARAAALRTLDGVEVLPAPDATPSAPGVIGVWTDGLQHAVVAVLTPEGRRIFVDATGETLSSNSPVAFGR